MQTFRDTKLDDLYRLFPLHYGHLVSNLCSYAQLDRLANILGRLKHAAFIYHLHFVLGSNLLLEHG